MLMHALDKRTYLDADGKATTDESKGVSLLGIEGDEITMDAAYSAGLVKTEPTADEAPAAKMLYYNQDGKRVAAGSADARFQYLDNDPTRPDADKASSTAQESAGDDYDSMKKDDLRTLAERRGVELDDNAKVAEIREALRAADKE